MQGKDCIFDGTDIGQPLTTVAKLKKNGQPCESFAPDTPPKKQNCIYGYQCSPDQSCQLNKQSKVTCIAHANEGIDGDMCVFDVSPGGTTLQKLTKKGGQCDSYTTDKPPEKKKCMLGVEC